MRDAYDFSNGARGKFYYPDADVALPVHLDPEVHRFLAARAAAQGMPLSVLVNRLLQKDIKLIQAAS